MQEFVRDLLEPFVAEKQSANHHERHDRDRKKRADQQRGRHQDQLVDERSFRDGPHHRQFTINFHPRDLLRVECEVVSHDSSCFLHSDFGKQSNVVQQGGDVVNKHQQA